jgi:AcrR family transcriptional regulator
VRGRLGRPRTADAPLIRRRILDCAATAFLEAGYDKANLDDIADAAGVSKITIYRHFQNKIDLFAQMVRDLTQGMAASLRETLDPARPVEEVLLAFAELRASLMVKPVVGDWPMFEMLRLVISVALRMPDLARAYLDNFYDDMAKPLSEYLKEKCEAGQLTIEDCDLAAGYFVQTNFFVEAILVNPTILPTEERRREIARQTVDLFLMGCRNRPAG